MSWTGQWSIKVDGHELNSIMTGGPYITQCPEIDWLHEQDVKLVPRDGDYPAYVGMQPREGNYTFLIQMKPCSEATYDTQLAELKGWLSPGQHTFAFQIRGMPTAKSVVAVIRGVATEFKARRVTALATAPNPVLT